MNIHTANKNAMLRISMTGTPVPLDEKSDRDYRTHKLLHWGTPF